ncbi:MAG: MarR family transcriptional regulator [Acidimicrobiales bacterium]
MSLFLVLHALRVKGVAVPEAIGVAMGLDVDEIHHALAELESQGLVRTREGVVAGWTLTSLGRDRDREFVDAELDATNARVALERIYGGFRPLNSVFLRACTDWQIRNYEGERVVNDHGDPDYDKTVLATLVTVCEQMQLILNDVIATLGRFGPYRIRLERALDRVVSGQLEWFTGPLIDSVHTVWFELHEDLLATLNVARSSEVGS